MDERTARIIDSLSKLTPTQVTAIDELVEQFLRPYLQIDRNPDLNFIDDKILADFGDMLRLHHCFSKGPFSKDKFEYALELSFNQAGYQATLAPPSNPTYDITVENQKFSLKTEAAQAIKLNAIHISKFMELGKGIWEDKIEHLAGLRERFLDRLMGCDRILILRNFQKNPWGYELVEIPVSLLAKASQGELYLNNDSRQNPKPSYCDVIENDERLFQLYFDGGTERKLQVKHLQKKFCEVHATWIFEVKQIQTEEANDLEKE